MFSFTIIGVSTKRILKSRDAIAKDLNLPYPFANSKLLTDGISNNNAMSRE
jgi:hypothetical protein